MKGSLFLILFSLTFSAGLANSASPDSVLVRGGKFIPLYGTEKEKPIKVSSFMIDKYPVTNKRFSEFVQSNPQWRKENVLSLYADEGYLRHWKAEREGTAVPLPEEYESPVVQVSWFAAQSFCKSKGGTLPTVLQWEYAAASEHTPDASRDPAFVQQLLAWYGSPSPTSLPSVGMSTPNYWGIYDLHGLVWEWTHDFNSVFVSGDNRRDMEKLQNMFCGGASADSTDRTNYAAFMRYAFRNSLKGHYTTSTLGFRCVYKAK